jgi:hypothetical protein
MLSSTPKSPKLYIFLKFYNLNFVCILTFRYVLHLSPILSYWIYIRLRILVRFEVLIAMVMKCTIFWDITQCIPLKVNRRLGGTYRLHLQGRRISRARTSVRAGVKQSPCLPPVSTLVLARLIFGP